MSDTVIDILIPSFPGSPRSTIDLLTTSLTSLDGHGDLKEALDFLHHDDALLTAAEVGDVKLLEHLVKPYSKSVIKTMDYLIYLKNADNIYRTNGVYDEFRPECSALDGVNVRYLGVELDTDQTEPEPSGVNIHEMDHLGRNALHFAVYSGNRHAVLVLLNAGVNPNVKDNLGMTPLSLCLMRKPSWRMANMLFDYGAEILPRSNPMDTGLFIQFIMMCVPTKEDERIIRLLVEKGFQVNDPEAPGKRQALHFAAMSNNCQLIKILMELGADLFSKNHRNETPKEVAATYRCKDAFNILQEFENQYKSSTGTTSHTVS